MNNVLKEHSFNVLIAVNTKQTAILNCRVCQLGFNDDLFKIDEPEIYIAIKSNKTKHELFEESRRIPCN